MKSYGYVARDIEGVQKKGITEASSSSDVLERLRSEGFTPISIKEISDNTTIQTKRKGRSKRIKSSDLAALCWKVEYQSQPLWIL
jgi:type II secretory pathway component PulF